MRIYTKYKTLRSRKKKPRPSLWVVPLLLLLGGVGWVFWHYLRPSFTTEARPAPAVYAPPPPLVTNLPVPRPVMATTSAPPVSPVAVPPPATPAVPPVEPPQPRDYSFTPRASQNLLEAQIAMIRAGISSGPLDGVMGSQTRRALLAYQAREHLPQTADLDTATKASLILSAPPYTNYLVTSEDLARLRPLAPTWLGKSQQDRLDYETILEMVAEKGQAHSNFVRRLNPEVNWTNVTAGTEIKIPNVWLPYSTAKVSFLKIFLAEKTLQAFDVNSNLLALFPCSIARRVEKRPVGELQIVKIAPNPNYLFDPEVFPESAEGRELNRKLMIPPGPNNPVGVAWIGLSRPGYGIHGTPKPEEVGRTESHGCFRLANWNAEWLVRRVASGVPVYVEP